MKKGDVLVEIGGWEQTNVTFYEVIDFKGKTATLQEVGNNHIEQLSSMSSNVIPDLKNKLGEPFKKRAMLCKYTNREYCKMSYHRAILWDGRPCFTSCWG